MCGLAAPNRPRLTRLVEGFQDNLTGLNNSQTFSQNIPNFSSSQTLLILVVHNTRKVSYHLDIYVQKTAMDRNM